ncbi:MAG: hypothetical protein IJA07_07930 [Agathobacter sp.]|nr:hypothetical protein [Agathobacter sp.]
MNNNVFIGHGSEKKQKLNPFRAFFHWIFLFCFLFEFPMFGFITSRRLCAVYAICTIFIKSKPTKSLFRSLKVTKILLASFLFMFCICICAINYIGIEMVDSNIYYEIQHFFWQIIYIVIGAFFCVVEFRDLQYFSKLYLSIMFLQSVVTYIAVINKPFRLFIYDNFYFGDNRFESTIQWGTRVMGINLHASLGSIILFTGCALLIYLRLTEKISVSKFVIEYMIILLATFFIGRTGFYLELVFLVLYFLVEKNLIKKFVYFVIGGALALFFLQGILSQISPTISNILITWVSELFNSETRFNTIGMLAQMEVPRFSQEMIFGTNVTLGITPLGQKMGSDSGYAKVYCAIGIVGAICYYLSYLNIFLATKMKGNKITKIFLVGLIAVAFVVEYKEPYFQKYVYAFFVFTLLLFNSREEYSK